MCAIIPTVSLSLQCCCLPAPLSAHVAGHGCCGRPVGAAPEHAPGTWIPSRGGGLADKGGRPARGLPVRVCCSGRPQRGVCVGGVRVGGWRGRQRAHLRDPLNGLREPCRVWITAEPHPQFPIGLLQMGIKITNEAPVGMKVRGQDGVIGSARPALGSAARCWTLVPGAGPMILPFPHRPVCAPATSGSTRTTWTQSADRTGASCSSSSATCTAWCRQVIPPSLWGTDQALSRKDTQGR